MNKYYRFCGPVRRRAFVVAGLRRHVTLEHFPAMRAEWKAATLPRAAPKRSGWHRVVIEVKNHEAETFWDSIDLARRPVHWIGIGSGFIGVYATYTGGRGIAETKIDGLQVRRQYASTSTFMPTIKPTNSMPPNSVLSRHPVVTSGKINLSFIRIQEKRVLLKLSLPLISTCVAGTSPQQRIVGVLIIFFFYLRPAEYVRLT